MKEEGKIIIIVAPSGTGKSTLIKELKREVPHLLESVSYTTRPRREGEEDGTHYFFTTVESFESMIEKEAFLEWAKVHENYYGTSKEFVEDQLRNGRDLLFDLDTQGVDSFKKVFDKKAIAIFIAPPSHEDLKTRLMSRGTESREAMAIRLKNAENELKRQNDYDYLVINDDFNIAKEKLVSIVKSVLE